MSVNVWFKQEEREDMITGILKVGVTSQCKHPKYSVFYAMTVEGQARCNVFIVDQCNYLKRFLLNSDIFCQKFPAKLDGVISQNNKTGISMIMDKKIHSISF